VYAFLGTSVRRINEDIAITVLSPEVDPMDFSQAANAIPNFIILNFTSGEISGYFFFPLIKGSTYHYLQGSLF
jgi:hypothetical protein